MFREIRNNNMERNLISPGFDPDKRVVPTEVIIEETRKQNENSKKKFDPDKRVNWD